MRYDNSIKQVIQITLVIFLVCGLNVITYAQTYTGNLGITNNGFSIIPTFSFNSPAVTTQMSWEKNNWSVEPDIRLAPDLTKGSMLLWFRYVPIQKGKFSLRTGLHPAINWFPKNIIENDKPSELYQLRRFLAWELAPNFKINKNLNVGIYYLQGNGLQENGVRTSHFLNLYLGASNIALNDQINLSLTPAVYYLNVDKKAGTYFTANGSISHKKSPFSLQSTINKTLQTKITGGKNFLWNIALIYKIK